MEQKNNYWAKQSKSEQKKKKKKKKEKEKKCTPSFTKSPSLVHIDPIVSKIQPFKNIKIYNNMYGHPHTVCGWPNISV